MRNRLSKILSIGLIVILTFALAGCGGDKKKLIGTWEYGYDLSDEFNEKMQSDGEMGKYFNVEDCILMVKATFKEDGTYVMGVDEACVSTLKAKVEESLTKAVEEYLSAEIDIESLGGTLDETLAQMGTSIEDIVAGAGIDKELNELVESSKSEGKYEVKDGKLFTSDSLDAEIDENKYETYELEDDKLTLLEYVDTDATEEDKALYPLEYKKVSE